jgi:hypothetical protein
MLMSLIVLGFVEGIFVRQELLRMKINGLNPDSTHLVSTFYLFVFVLSKKTKNGIGIRSDVSGSTIENRKDYTSLIFTGSHIWTETSVFVNCGIIPTTNTLSQQTKKPTSAIAHESLDLPIRCCE